MENAQQNTASSLLTETATELQPLEPLPQKASRFSVFLAGSIDQGRASDWQRDIIDSFAYEDILFFNPRRKFWNDNWKQDAEDLNFRGQVNWEIDALERSDIIVMYLEPGTLSPISLMEFGLFARSKKLVVCCPEGYWRKGTVDVVCERFGILQVNSLDEIKEYIKNIMEGPAPTVPSDQIGAKYPKILNSHLENRNQ